MDQRTRLLEAALFAAPRPLALDELGALDAEAIERAAFSSRPVRLSTAALEVLAIISYRQPVGRAEVEEIRGVSSAGVLRLLQERGLIEVSGRSEGLGRPLLYATTPQFLEYLGLGDLADLPRSDELTIALAPPPADG